MASKIVEKILEGATDLFSRQSYFGTTTREIAVHADVTEPSIYRLFLTKEKLFERCLTAVIAQLLEPARFLMALSGEEKGGEFPVLVAHAVRRWYSSLSTQAARLLMQAALSENKQWSKMAYEPLERIISILARRLERDMRVPRHTAAVSSRTLILALFQFKLARPLLSSSESERDAVERTIEQWLHGFSSAR